MRAPLPNQKVVFRCDGSSRRGMGHVVRCLTLAQLLVRAGFQVSFVTRSHEPGGADLIASAGYELSVLVEDATPEEDVAFTAMVSRDAAVVVTDGYFVDDSYQQRIVDETGAVLVCIDDLSGARFVADLVVNSNLHAKVEQYQAPEGTRFLLGPDFALIRNEFLHARPEAPWVGPAVNRILVTMGGSDPPDFTSTVMEWLAEMKLNVPVTYVLGPGYSGAQRALRSQPEHLFDVVLKPHSVLPLFVAADLVLSAAGTTCWELAFLGKAFVTVAIADNQRPVADELHRVGAAWSLGFYADVERRAFQESILKLMRSRRERQRLADGAHALVDGEGKYRVVSAIQELIRVRKRS